MNWITRARPKTDRIACPWLIHRFIDPDADHRLRPADQVLTTAAERGGHSFDAPGATYTHQPAPDGQGEWCTFETLIAAHQLNDNRALRRLAAIVHAADIDADLHTDPSARDCSPSAWAAWTSKPTTRRCCNGACSCTTPSTPGAPARSRRPGHRHEWRPPRRRRHPGRRRAAGRDPDGRGRDHRPEVRRPTVPRRQTSIPGNGYPRGPGQPDRTGRLDAGPWAGTPGNDRSACPRTPKAAEAVTKRMPVRRASRRTGTHRNYDCGAMRLRHLRRIHAQSPPRTIRTASPPSWTFIEDPTERRSSPFGRHRPAPKGGWDHGWAVTGSWWTSRSALSGSACTIAAVEAGDRVNQPVLCVVGDGVRVDDGGGVRRPRSHIRRAVDDRSTAAVPH